MKRLLSFFIVLSLIGSARPQNPWCFLVLDYLFSFTRKLQFYVELAVYIYKKVAFIAFEGDHIVIIFIISFAFTHAAEVRSTHWHPCSLSLRE